MELPLDQKPSLKDERPNGDLEPSSFITEGGDRRAVSHLVFAETAAETGPGTELQSSRPSVQKEETDLERQLRRLSRRGFATGGSK
jgi:hypothetical protein